MNTKPETKIVTQIHPLDEVLEYFSKTLEPYDGEKIVRIDWCLDANNDRVEYKLHVQKEEKP